MAKKWPSDEVATEARSVTGSCVSARRNRIEFRRTLSAWGACHLVLRFCVHLSTASQPPVCRLLPFRSCSGQCAADGKVQQQSGTIAHRRTWHVPATQFSSADGSSEGGKASAAPQKNTAKAGKSCGADVNQPATPERPPTVALSGMSLSGRAAKGALDPVPIGWHVCY